jgi:DNA-directed RNA polymerase specialized sigma24 family protein
MSATMAFPSKPDPCDERALAERLLAALERGDVDEARLIQGGVFGMHRAKLRIFVASLTKGRPEVHIDEVFSNAAERMFVEMGDPKKVRWVLEVGSFRPLLNRIARDEVIDYWRGRKPYADDRRTVSGLRPGQLEAVEPENPISTLLDADAFATDAARILTSVGGERTLDGLLLILIDMYGVTLRQFERLLVLAQWADREAAVAEASTLLKGTEEAAAQHLELVRGCRSAHPMNYNALKVALHRARKRARGNLGPEELDGLS